MFVIAVTGWRHHADGGFIRAVMDQYQGVFLGMGEVMHVRHGDAPGADTIVDGWCISRGVSHHRFVADWDRFGDLAGPNRNREMLLGQGDPIAQPTQLLLGFPRTSTPIGRTRVPGSGTWGCLIMAAEELRIEVRVPAYVPTGQR